MTYPLSLSSTWHQLQTIYKKHPKKLATLGSLALIAPLAYMYKETIQESYFSLYGKFNDYFSEKEVKEIISTPKTPSSLTPYIGIDVALIVLFSIKRYYFSDQ